jgi:hypothetical protein
MPAPHPLTAEQLQVFADRGILRLEGLIPAEACADARAYIQRRLSPLGYWRDGAWRLEHAPRVRHPAAGVKASRVIGNKDRSVEALIEGPEFRAVIDRLLDGRPFDRSMHPRPQLLFTLPNLGPWQLPGGWHADSPRLASGACPGVQMFACLDEMAPRGGGTLMIAGSHKLFDFGRLIRGKEATGLVRDDPFVSSLLADKRSWDADTPLPRGRSGDIELEVVEATGGPGDAYLVDLRTLHTGAPNATERPRMMVTDRFMPTDLVQEIAEAYGWT